MGKGSGAAPEEGSGLETQSSVVNQPVEQRAATRPFGRDWLNQILSSGGVENERGERAALVVAPMVDQSDLPFRLLCRKHGANLAFTPMIHARLFCEMPSYEEKFWKTPPAQDRPLVAQFCGGDPQFLVKAAMKIQHEVDAIDINCGCPQGIARRGKYGAFLLEDPDQLVKCVTALVKNVSVPVCVKVRILPTGLEDSLVLYRRLVHEAGASMLTIHGRNRHQKGHNTGKADWDAIRRVVDELGHFVPILANGGISNMDDVRECLRVTKADGVMSSEGILEYPALFSESGTASVGHKRTGPGRLELARQYMEFVHQHPPEEGGQGSGPKCVRVHLHKFLHEELQANPVIRTQVAEAFNVPLLEDALTHLEQFQTKSGHMVETEQMSWYMRHRGRDIENLDSKGQSQTKQTEIADNSGACFANLFGEEEEEEEQDGGEVCSDDCW